MPVLNFTSQVIIGTIAGFSIFPGYVAGWILDLFQFRARFPPAHLTISLLLSIAISPIFYYLVASLFSLNIALIITALFVVAFLVLLIFEKPSVQKNGQWQTSFWISLG